MVTYPCTVTGTTIADDHPTMLEFLQALLSLHATLPITNVLMQYQSTVSGKKRFKFRIVFTSTKVYEEYMHIGTIRTPAIEMNTTDQFRPKDVDSMKTVRLCAINLVLALPSLTEVSYTV